MTYLLQILELIIFPFIKDLSLSLQSLMFCGGEDLPKSPSCIIAFSV